MRRATYGPIHLLGAALIITGLTISLTESISGQTLIDFETLPNGEPTADQQPISNQYAVGRFAPSFILIDSEGRESGFPHIAKVGPPRTAFQGCMNGDDEPAPDQGIGQSFLTDDERVGWSGNVEVRFEQPISAASGVLIDVDRPDPGKFEQWTITGFDTSGDPVAEVVLTAPEGPDTSCATVEGVGPGEGAALSWSLESETASIASIFFAYTGTHTFVGFALDNFRFSTEEPGRFIRGDCNGDGRVEAQVTDAVFLLEYNFTGGREPSCLAACDVDGNGRVNGQITDAVYLLNHNFLGGQKPPDPFPECGAGPLETDEDLGCETPPESCR